jgi:hypothetical protein
MSSSHPVQDFAISSGTVPTQKTPSTHPHSAQKASATPLPLFGALMDTSCIGFLQDGHVGLTIDMTSSFQKTFEYYTSN